ncbi:MAG: hypothetical protein AAF846_27360 [Chloroflexota bacterium]
MTNDTKQSVIDNESTLNEINTFIKPLIDQICWKITKSYGGAYILDFGESISFGQSILGTWFINTYGTNFILTDSNEQVLINTQGLDIENPSTEQIIVNALGKLNKKSVATINVDYDTLQLNLKFDDETVFRIIPTCEDDQYEDLPYWLIHRPDNNYLTVGPSRKFSINKKNSN